MPLPSLICIHDDWLYLPAAIRAASAQGPVHVFVSRLPWHGEPGDWEEAKRQSEQAGAEVHLGEWGDEASHRAAALAFAREKGIEAALVLDSDEVISKELAVACAKAMEVDLADRIYCEMDTYWHSPSHVIRPPEPKKPIICLRPDRVEHEFIREYSGGRGLVLGRDHGVLHHLSYSGPEERIRRKISSWSHRDEVDPRWLEQKWRAWQRDPLVRDLHPTHPSAYRQVERISTPAVLEPAMSAFESAGGRNFQPLATPVDWPRISVTIPLHGGEEDIRLCLESLTEVRDLLHQVVVVDNASPDKAAEVAESFDIATVLRQKKNLGFGEASNLGYRKSSGEVVLFLNSDTVVPRSGLIRLIESLLESGSVAAAGPMSNAVRPEQLIEPTYGSMETMGLFADDFAHRQVEDEDTDFLVGFCLAVRRSALDEIGAFDERFGIGTFEDNDLCYRMRRAGYRLRRSNRAFVHHRGSATLERVSNPDAILSRNQRRYETKWHWDIESGYASHLAGLAPGSIEFDDSKKPERLLAGLADDREAAGISLCMIVKDEADKIADCLRSARPFFSEMIVVDTGSSDGTAEIAEKEGAKVFEFPWTDSFSEARNESLRHATGRWVFWMDADDVLPIETGRKIISAAINAPKDVTAFLVPVKFTDEGPGGGTQVDHVKLIRNFEGLEFTLHIHEQVLPSIRKHGGEIVRIGSPVLHANYDTSDGGQEKKRERDKKLLAKDLKDNPEHPFVLFNLGMTSHYLADHEEAIEWLDRCLEHSTDGESHVRKAHVLRAVSIEKVRGAEDALQAIEEGIKAVGDDVEMEFHAGRLLAHMGHHAEAVPRYEKAVSLDSSAYFSSYDQAIQGYKGWHNLGVSLLEAGRHDEAITLLQRAALAAPDHLSSHAALVDAFCRTGDFAKARHHAEVIRSREGASLSYALAREQIAQAQGGPQAAAQDLMSLNRENPRSAPIMKVLSKRLLDMGHEHEARPHLMQLAEAGDPESAFFLGVTGVRGGDFKSALRWMRRAHELNPEHRQTIEEIRKLEAALEGSA